jgi:hypothetical protein
MYLAPAADEALQLAALAHDIDRAIEGKKTQRADYDDYDVFKAAHAHNGAGILRAVLTACGVERGIVVEACRLVATHEIGGDQSSDLLKDADSISFFEVNLPFYFQREGWDKAKQRSSWGYQRLSARAKEIVKNIVYGEDELVRLLREVIHESVT